MYDDGSNPSYAPTIFYFMFNNYLYSNRQSVKISGLWVFGATGSMAVSKTADRGSNPLSPALYLIYITCEGGNFVFLFFLFNIGYVF